MARGNDPSEAPDPRIRGRIPTLTEVVGPLDWPPALGDAAGAALPDGPPFLDLGDDEARSLDDDRPLGDRENDEQGGDVAASRANDAAAPDDDAAWTEALLARMAPQIEQIIRDAMRDAQFAALAQVRIALRSQIEAARRAMPVDQAGHGAIANPSAAPSSARTGGGQPPDA